MLFDLYATEDIQLKSDDIKPLRDQILEEQEYICPICNKGIVNPCLDHGHVKRLKLDGKIRGVICLNCNVFLGKIENKAKSCKISMDELPSVLRNIAEYLEIEPFPFIHPSEKRKEKLLKKASYNKLIKELKKSGYDKKIPDYPKSGKVIKKLSELFELTGVKPEFYKREGTKYVRKSGDN